MLYYLVVYAFANVGAFAVAAWLARDKDSDNIDDLNGLGFQEPLLATCILILMLSLIGIPPLAGFFGKLYVFMEALDQTEESQQVTLIWLVALGLLNSVVSAFYYVRVLKAMFLREPGTRRLAAPDRGIALPIVAGHRRRGRLRHHARLADERDAGRRRADADRARSSQPLDDPARPARRRALAAAASQTPNDAAPRCPRQDAQRKATTLQTKGGAHGQARAAGACRRSSSRRQRRRPSPTSAQSSRDRPDGRHRPLSIDLDRPRAKSRTAPEPTTRRHGHGHHQHLSEVP